MRRMVRFVRRMLQLDGEPSPSGPFVSYRYISLSITSACYLLGPFPGGLFLKLAVVSCLIMGAITATIAYRGQENSARGRRLLAVLEMLGLLLVLVFSGGVRSPFFWYAINPVLLSVTLEPKSFWFLTATFFLVGSALLQLLVLGRAQPLEVTLNYYLAYSLLVAAAWAYNQIIRRLSRQTQSLRKHVHHTRLLYEAIEVFAQRSEPQGIANLFASYAKSLTGATKVIVWLEAESSAEGLRNHFSVRGPRKTLPEKDWLPYVQQVLRDRTGVNERRILKSLPGASPGAGLLMTVWVRSAGKNFGVLSAYYPKGQVSSDVEETLLFLADLCGTSLERYSLEALSEKFLLVEQKNSIANRIHDSVAQDFFSLVYGIDELLQADSLDDSVRRRLALLQKTARQSMKDLRSAIYRMSTLKNADEPFVEAVGSYLENFAEINNIEVAFECDKETKPDLDASARDALYRIVREGTGNALRHGRCSRVTVKLAAQETGSIRLTIVDNGKGFCPETVIHESGGGLGLISMKEQARSLGGSLRVVSTPGQGTRIVCEVPQMNDARDSQEASAW